MDFLEKIRPHLLSDDFFVQEFVMHALQEYPNVPPEWTELLLREAIDSKEKELVILANIDKFTFTDGAVALLAEGYRSAAKDRKHLFARLIANLDPELILEHRSTLAGILTPKAFELNEFLLNGGEEELWEEYGSVLAAMERDENFQQDLYTKAKRLAITLVK
ncbi:hypothetical protein [Bacillus sp. T33-2]|uniref:hypothetical protein n=1 Tax=Bacillus sp. T33-2 TaxID=2054168 RepID=UPI000C792CF7|nr:hypothetical protein [Bacillus sp. T33-2]PLR91110.1 hypothetical protein CVD19_22140 [Bacillus sp. T33-2]